ncbi:universal stress protein [Halovenus sp. HT40]|jgi:nucleotide-binding universal stress UspA family protein|uniref:universal stress protein n=1 Tax=Halovenus sp. HT40 TaxID=3126691 RepID=UPI00300EB71C
MRVLLGIEDTDHGIKALETTVERAKETDDELTVAVYATDGSVDETESAVRDRIETLGADCSVERIESEPGSRLVELAERDGYDQIVLSGGQRSPLGKIKLDDVHEFVLLNSRTTVKLVR